MKLTDLPKWKSLSKVQKARFKIVFKDRVSQDYNIMGKLSVSKKELKKGAKNG